MKLEETKFIDVIRNMQEKVEHSETQFVGIFLQTDNHVLEKGDTVVMTEEGFISVNDEQMYNITFITGAGIMSLKEPKKEDISVHYG